MSEPRRGEFAQELERKSACEEQKPQRSREQYPFLPCDDKNSVRKRIASDYPPVTHVGGWWRNVQIQGKIDGARTIFLYTKGTEGNPPEELRQLLHYMENTTEENATSDSLKSLNRMVDAVKHDKEVSLNYMKTVEWEEMLIKQGRMEGWKEEQANTERERLRADHEAARADSASERADSEAARADRAEKELVLLKKQLASIKSRT